MSATRSAFDSWEELIPLDRVAGPPFPADPLPSPFKEWALQSAEAIQVPVDLPAMLDLGLVGAIVSKVVQVRLPNGHPEPLNAWVLAALESGERKSAMYRE